MNTRPRHRAPTGAPPPIHLQAHICEHRKGPDEFRSELIRRDRFLGPDNAEAYLELVKARLRPDVGFGGGAADDPRLGYAFDMQE